MNSDADAARDATDTATDTLPPITSWQELTPSEQQTLLARPKQAAEVAQSVAQILLEVQRGGEAALLRLTERFDGVRLSKLRLSTDELRAQAAQLSPAVQAAIDAAHGAIWSFHAAQLPASQETASQEPTFQGPAPTKPVATWEGVTCELRQAPLRSVGLYVPGGTAPLPSSVLMLGIPAALAGCERTVLCSPPTPEGLLPPAVCYAALKVGVSEVLTLGGAQAIAALAYGVGTEAVDKVFGPGNAYVTEAKAQLSAAGLVAADLPAGPSELLIIADSSAHAPVLAADLLSQAEHGTGSQVMLLCTDPELLRCVRAELGAQLSRLPRREHAERALAGSRLIFAPNLESALEVADRYAPEHLSLQVREAERCAHRVRAGSVFVGHSAAQAAGDYATGTNHVLPTAGAARAFSSLSVADFMRRYTVQTMTTQGLRALAPTVTTLARAEGLEAHARALEVRLEATQEGKKP